MGAEISQLVKSDLEGSTLKELLSEEEFIQRIQGAVSVLDEKVCSNLRKLLTKTSTKRRSKKNRRPGSTPKGSPLSRDAVVGISAQDNAPQQAAAAGTNDAGSGATIASSTTSGVTFALSTTSNVTLPTVPALLGERALSFAVLGENGRTQSLWEVKEYEVALPPEIADSFDRWKADPSAFLRNDSLKAPTSLTEHYTYALSVRTSATTNKILWRFVTTAYYDVISARSQSDRYSITKEAVAFAVAVVCNSSSYKREVVEANLISWARDGGKNRALANKLGGTGCYFYYPQHLSEWIWIKHLPLSAYDKAAKLLNEFCILEKAQQSGAVDLAKSIETILKAPFQSTVPTQSLGEWILPIPSQQTTGSAGGAAPLDNISGLQKRKLKAGASPRNQRGSVPGIAQRPCLHTAQLYQDLVIGDEQAADSHSPRRDSFVSTPSTTRSQGIGSITSTTHSLQSLTADGISYRRFERPLVSAQGSDNWHNIQAETDQRDQELPTWLQLQQSHQQNTYAQQSLLSLICAMGTLPKLMLDRALSPQKRWNEYGVEYQIDPRHTRFDHYLKTLLLDSDRLWQVLRHLVSIAAVNVENFNEMGVYFYGSTSAEYLDSQERISGIEQGLWLFCYVFPHNPTTLETLWAVLEDLLRLYAEIGREIPSNDEVIETLLAVSKIGPLPRRRLILSAVDPLLKKTSNGDLKAEAVYQTSVVLRLDGNIAGSNELLEEFLNRSDIATQLKSHSILGLLHLSHAANDTYNLDFLSASKRAKIYIPPVEY
ncbi:hypothetical protein EG327_000466 [Venturia inaequalis]|uniref:Uncharacterized protein n=1 Tax=Venturia inaequalis TaxID=5025 RepID=A0A8H3UB46_VENIN|nr:hypothetical protein EG327_000466 [Venturia inaequalis]